MKEVHTNNKNDGHNSAKYFTRGGQIVFHNWRMLFQINAKMMKFYFAMLSLFSIVCTYLITPKEVLMATIFYAYSKLELLFLKIHLPIKSFVVFYHGKPYLENGISFLSQWEFIEEYRQIYGYACIGFLISFFVSLVVTYYFIKWLTGRGKEQASSKFLRG